MWSISRRTALVQRRSSVAAAGLVLLMGATAPAANAAQTTRAEEIAAAQEKKAQALHPYQPGAVERLLTEVQRRFLGTPERLLPVARQRLQRGRLHLGAGYRQFLRRPNLLGRQGAALGRKLQARRSRVQAPGLGAGPSI